MKQIVENTTSLQFHKTISICNGLPVVDQSDCKPTGEGWKKENLGSLDLTTLIRKTDIKSNLDDYENRLKIAKSIYNHYIFFIKDEVSLNACHKVDIFSSDIYNPSDTSKIKYVDHSHNINTFVQVYSEEAINKAEVILDSYSKNKDYSFIDAKFKIKFRVALRDQINKNLKSSGKLMYIILKFSNSGLPNDSSILNTSEFIQCQNQFSKGKELIIGIAGIVLAGFKNEGEVFNKSWFEAAFQTALSNNQTPEAELVKDLSSSAAVHWSTQVNTEIQTTIQLLSGSDFFYPTWILTAKQSFFKRFFLN